MGVPGVRRAGNELRMGRESHSAVLDGRAGSVGFPSKIDTISSSTTRVFSHLSSTSISLPFPFHFPSIPLLPQVFHLSLPLLCLCAPPHPPSALPHIQLSSDPAGVMNPALISKTISQLTLLTMRWGCCGAGGEENTADCQGCAAHPALG